MSTNTREPTSTAWRAVHRAAHAHADPGVWRTRLAAQIHAASRRLATTHVTVVTCMRDRPDQCDYGFYPRRDLALGDLVFARIMPRLLDRCRGKWLGGMERFGPVVPVFEVFGGGPAGGPFREGCLAAGIESALLAGFWVDAGLVGYLMVAAAGEEMVLWRELAPPLERVVADVEKTLAFATRLASEGERWPPHHEGLASLSPREGEVARLAAEGYSDVNIAGRLGISEATVGTHLHRIYRKLSVHNRVGLVQRLASSHRDPTRQEVSDPHERAALAFEAATSARPVGPSAPMAPRPEES